MNHDRPLGVQLAALAELADALRSPQLAASIRGLRERYERGEWMVVMLGETASGKSTWLNTLLGEDLLPATPGTTTGTPVEIRVSGVTRPEFEAVSMEGEVTPLDRDRFRALCRESDVWRLRVRWPLARLSATRLQDLSALRGLVLLDAPGYNSCFGVHREILVDALPEADAVLTMLNYRRGFTPQDAEFAKLVHDIRSDPEPARLFAVNWTPVGKRRRLQTMQQELSDRLGTAYPLHVLEREGSGRVEIWNSDLWQSLLASSGGDRARQVEANTRAAARHLADKLLLLAESRMRVAAATEAQLEGIRQTIARLDDLGSRANGLIDGCTEDLLSITDAICESARTQIWKRTQEATDEAGRFTEADECSAYVTGHIVPFELREAVARLEGKVQERTDALGQSLEDLIAHAEDLPLPPVHIRSPVWESLRNHAAEQGVRRLSEAAFTQYLRGLGGAAGPKSGFVNLAKKLVSRGGKLVGKTFSREFYNGMGQMLRRIGLTAGFATAAFATVVTEALAYLYRVVRWKAKLRGLIQLVLGMEPTEQPFEDAIIRSLPIIGSTQRLPVEELRTESQTAIRDAMGATRTMVEENFARRADVLRDALAQRSDGEFGRLERLAERLLDLRSHLDPRA